jgi:hypothetical protein
MLLQKNKPASIENKSFPSQQLDQIRDQAATYLSRLQGSVNTAGSIYVLQPEMREHSSLAKPSEQGWHLSRESQCVVITENIKHIASAGLRINRSRPSVRSTLEQIGWLPRLSGTEKKTIASSERVQAGSGLDWVEQNCKYLERFAGEWLLVVGEELVAHSTRPAEIVQIVKERRPVGAFIHYVPRLEEAAFTL